MIITNALLSCLAVLGDLSTVVVPTRHQYVENFYTRSLGAVEDALENKCPGVILEIDKSNSNCKYLVRRNPTSRVCYFETNVGFVTTSFDFLGHAIVTFHRWD